MKVITGSTGGVGGEVARLLAQSGTPLRLLVRDPLRAPPLPNCQVVKAAYDDPASLASAMQAGDEVFMVSIDLSHDDRMRVHGNFIDAAAKARVGHIVYLSFMCAGPKASFLHAQAHGETEYLIKATGIPYTFLRTSYYDKVSHMIYEDGLVFGPGGEGRLSWVSREDCGAVVAAVMRDPKAHVNKVYDITGPEALSLAETSAIISEITGYNYRYVEGKYDPDEVSKNLPAGLPKYYPWYRLSSFRAIAAGEFSIVSDAIERLTGRKPRSFREYVEKNKQLYPPSKG